MRNWVAGNLPDDIADLITEHIDQCPRCETQLSLIEQAERLHDALPDKQGFLEEAGCQALLDALENQTFISKESENPTDIPPGANPEDDPDPEVIGRYDVERVVGAGGFGKVYLAIDSELGRRVAVKVPHRHRIGSELDMQMYLEEARTLAQLDHPNVVPIHDMGRLPDGRCYFVSKFIDGHDLGEKLKHERYSMRDAIELVATIADALGYVHDRGIVHRDIKPKNILLNEAGTPFLTDFGLAIQFEHAERSDLLIGTPQYMSPEQARGEGHLVDGRSDIFSLGVVLYLLLTGVRPFDGSKTPQTLHNVVHVDPKPLRQINPAIPKELDRACLTALSKRASDRYPQATLFAEDLRHLLTAEDVELNYDSTIVRPQLSEAESFEEYIGVVPKGLRAFDKRDANFFLNLLPGPRNRQGYPESIRFWKDWIESVDNCDTSRVGVIYGPSGCGKSSLVKAGVLPLLDDSIVCIVIECTPEGTEQRLLRALREACPFLKPDRSLSESLADIRLERELPAGTKVLLVLDQFEQWLHGTIAPETSELALALRQCDGEHTQTLLQVRDDFWLVLSRLMSAVEIPMIQGQNMFLVDLFDPIHARKVLMQFGQAFGRIPIPPKQPTPLQEHFLDDVTTELKVGEKVFPVRIALFAEMLKGRPWTLDTLNQLGGIQGVGTMFLEEAFSAPHAPVNQKIHEQAARDVLRSLLPDQGTDIKVCQKRSDELREASPYRDHPHLFEQLLRILEVDLKLISPTEAPEAGSLLQTLSNIESKREALSSVSSVAIKSTITSKEGMDEDEADQGQYYQLSHDYLIPSFREWLTRRQMQTYRGRLELQFEDRVTLWKARPYKRNLPTWWEWAQFRLFLSSQRWGMIERRMMSVSTKRYAFWTLMSCLLSAAFIWGALHLQKTVETNAIIAQIPSAELEEIPGIMQDLKSTATLSDSKWKRLLAGAQGDPKRELAVHLALLSENETQVEPVIERAVLSNAEGSFTVNGRDFQVLTESLKPHRSIAVKRLWTLLNSPQLNAPEQLRVAVLLAPLVESEVNKDIVKWRPHIAGLVEQLQVEDENNPAFVSEIIPALTAVAPLLAEQMWDVLGEEIASVSAFRKTHLLSEIMRDQPELLADSIVQASKWQIPRFLPKVEKLKGRVRPFLRKIADADVSKDRLDDNDDLAGRRKAMANALLYKWGENRTIADYLKRSPTPAFRSFLIHDLAAVAVPPEQLVTLLAQPSISTGTRCGLLQALGTYVDYGVTVPDSAIEIAERLFVNDPDAGVHSSARWLLQKVGKTNLNALIPPQDQAPGDKDWYLSPDTKSVFVRVDARKAPGVERVFDISATEVTLENFLKYYSETNYDKERTFSQDCPANVLTWYESVYYCRWLSEQAGIPEEQQCYPPEQEIRAKIEELGSWAPEPDHVLKTGYRLPTSEEWEYACRAGTQTERFFGNSDRLLAEYAWYGIEKGWMGVNAQWENHNWPIGLLKPNEFGLFDMFGNIQEWCINSNGERLEKRMMRGGGYSTYSSRLKASEIANSTPAEEWSIFGMRLIRTVSE